MVDTYCVSRTWNYVNISSEHVHGQRLGYKHSSHQFGPLLSICRCWRAVSGPARGGQGFLPVTHPEAVTPLLLGFHYVVTITTLYLHLLKPSMVNMSLDY